MTSWVSHLLPVQVGGILQEMRYISQQGKLDPDVLCGSAGALTDLGFSLGTGFCKLHYPLSQTATFKRLTIDVEFKNPHCLARKCKDSIVHSFILHPAVILLMVA